MSNVVSRKTCTPNADVLSTKCIIFVSNRKSPLLGVDFLGKREWNTCRPYTF